MFMTKGIVVDAGASFTQDPLYDDKIKIRIPELHGFGDLATIFQEDSYTLNEDLPWCKIIINSIDSISKYPILQYKAQTYAPADIVYVRVDSESPDTNYLVTGLYEKYNEDTSDTTTTTYNNIDVSSILANKVDFPANLIDPSLNDTTDDGSDNTSGGGGTSGGEAGEGADNTITEWKYVFGNPLAKKSLYYISAGFPRYSGGALHCGVDLSTSGKTGVAIYAVSDGTVVMSGLKGDAGNMVMIKHTTSPYCTFYEHMASTPYVKVGDTVKGTQLVAEIPWNKAYQKNGNEYQLLKQEPKDWKNGGWKNYYKNTGTSYNPVYEKIKDMKQEGTQIGVVGSTGHSTGIHLHFGITTDQNYWTNAKALSGKIKDPRNYISL